MKATRHRGSVLLMALFIIAVLSVMVLSFSMEARTETGLNVYVRERNRVMRLMDAGKVLGEIVLVGFNDVQAWSKDQDDDELFEKDRWFREKQQLKTYSYCTIGPIIMDEDDPESGTVQVDLAPINSEKDTSSASNAVGVIDINLLSKAGGDSKYQERWWMILKNAGVPEEFSTEKDGTIKLWDELIASWDDWRDEDDVVTSIDGKECGAEEKWYREEDEKNKIEDEYRVSPRNGAITGVSELGFVRGFRDYPQILYGGTLNPWEKDKKSQIVVGRGIASLFCVDGQQTIDVNSADVDTLITIPGVYKNPEEDDALEDARELAENIIKGKEVEPDDDDHDEKLGSWPYKDWTDLNKRLDEVDSSLKLGSEAQQYLSFQPDASKTIYRMRITGESMGMRHRVEALCYVKDKKVRYIEWNEEPAEGEEDENGGE